MQNSSASEIFSPWQRSSRSPYLPTYLSITLIICIKLFYFFWCKIFISSRDEKPGTKMQLHSKWKEVNCGENCHMVLRISLLKLGLQKIFLPLGLVLVLPLFLLDDCEILPLHQLGQSVSLPKPQLDWGTEIAKWKTTKQPNNPTFQNKTKQTKNQEKHKPPNKQTKPNKHPTQKNLKIKTKKNPQTIQNNHSFLILFGMCLHKHSLQK